MPWRRRDKGTRSGGLRGRLYVLAIVSVTVALAFGLRAGSLRAQSLWRDEVDALCYAFEFPHLVVQALAPQQVGALVTPSACPPSPVVPEMGGEPSLLARLAHTVRPMIQQNGPLYYFLLRGWIALAGRSEYALRFLSLWLGVTCVPLSYALGRRLLGRTVGIVTAVLVATSPYLVWYGQEVKMYSLVPALVLLSFYALRRGAEGGRAYWWAVQVVSTSLAFYTHIWSALLVPVQVVFLIGWWPRWRRHWPGVVLSLALVTLPYLPLALWQIPLAFVVRETGFPRRTLADMALILVNGWSLGVTGWAWPWGAVGCGLAALLGLVGVGLPPRPLTVGSRARRDRVGRTESACGGPGFSGHTPEAGPLRGSPLAGVVGWLVVPMIGIWFISRWQPLFTDRYLIWSALAFYILAAAGLALLWRMWRWPAPILLAAVLALFGASLRVQAATPIKSDLRGAAAFVEQHYQPGDLLVFQIPHVRYTFDYYFGLQDYSWADGLYTNHRGDSGAYLTTEELVSVRMRQIALGYERVWLVASEVAMWDERNLVQEWLEASGERAMEAHYVFVDVYGYRLRPP